MNADGRDARSHGRTERGVGAKELTFKGMGPPVTDGVLDEAERRLGVGLPPKYRSFLKRNNGGQPSRRVVRIEGHPQEFEWFDCFWGVGHPEPSLDLQQASGFVEYLERGLLPIGGAARASLWCLDVSKPGVEPVFCLTAVDPAEPAKAYFVANDIDELCESFLE